MEPSAVDARRTLIPFSTARLPQLFCDTLVIGAGVAGLRAAISAQRHGDVIVVMKDEPHLSNTAWAQGGIAAVTAAGDSVESHVADTLAAGAGLCDRAMVQQVVRAGPARIAELLEWGIRFDRDLAGSLRLGLEGGHSLHRILHAHGDATGRELFRCLWEKVSGMADTSTAAKGAAGGQGRVRVFTRCFTLDLLTDGEDEQGRAGGRVVGALTWHPRYGLQVIWSTRTILASGGAGMVYRETTNPKTATGDGIAMAWRAGAAVADMAFVQFHPTCLYLAGAPRSLITEAIRGEGGVLVDAAGERFLGSVHPQGELAPRDVVTKGIVEHLAQQVAAGRSSGAGGGAAHVYLDCRGIGAFADKFPGIAALLARYELDANRDLIPVHPAQHYTIGGVRTDLRGRSSLPGLWAVGEVACSGLHGANRLASNSLLEGLVMGQIAGDDLDDDGPTGAAQSGRGRGGGRPPVVEHAVEPSDAGDLDVADVESSLRSAMWRNVGIERSEPRLRSAVEMIEFWSRYTLDKVFDEPRGWTVQNMLTVARLIAGSAQWRRESRGCHWRSDAGATSSAQGVHDVVSRGGLVMEVPCA